jgi:hypothetical protein
VNNWFSNDFSQFDADELKKYDESGASVYVECWVYGVRNEKGELFMKQNIQRQLAMLSLIPRHPRRISTNKIKSKLKILDFDVGLRTVQREL